MSSPTKSLSQNKTFVVRVILKIMNDGEPMVFCCCCCFFFVVVVVVVVFVVDLGHCSCFRKFKRL